MRETTYVRTGEVRTWGRLEPALVLKWEPMEHLARGLAELDGRDADHPDVTERYQQAIVECLLDAVDEAMDVLHRHLKHGVDDPFARSVREHAARKWRGVGLRGRPMGTGVAVAH